MQSQNAPVKSPKKTYKNPYVGQNRIPGLRVHLDILCGQTIFSEILGVEQFSFNSACAENSLKVG